MKKINLLSFKARLTKISDESKVRMEDFESSMNLVLDKQNTLANLKLPDLEKKCSDFPNGPQTRIGDCIFSR